MTVLKDMTDTIKKGVWYSETLAKIENGSFSYKWLSDRLSGEYQPSYEAMHTVMDLVREKQQSDIDKLICENSFLKRRVASQLRMFANNMDPESDSDE